MQFREKFFYRKSAAQFQCTGGTEGFQAAAIPAVTDWTIRFHTDVFQRTAVHGKTLMNAVIGDYCTAEISI